jgi:hypothetical protein
LIIDKTKVRIREIERRIVRLFGGRSSRDVEYDFVYRNVNRRNLRILDIGGYESLIPLVFARAGHKVTAYDFRPYTERNPNLQIIQGDFMKNQLPHKSFDIILLISTIEHIGLGAYGMPEYKDADFEVMNKLSGLLADGGKLILTFPFNEKERIIPGFERWYTIDRIKQLLNKWFVIDVEFWVPDKKVLGRWVKWIPATADDAGRAYIEKGVQGVACFAVKNQPADWDMSW